MLEIGARVPKSSETFASLIVMSTFVTTTDAMANEALRTSDRFREEFRMALIQQAAIFFQPATHDGGGPGHRQLGWGGECVD